MNFAKRLCADDANLIEVIEINIDKDKEQDNIIRDVLKDNRFDTMYRKQIEEMSANGTVGAYVRVEDADVYNDGSIKGGKIKLCYCNALNIIPLTVINDEIIECAFTGASYVEGKKRTALVLFTLLNGTYTSNNIVFDETDKLVKKEVFPFGDVKPFSIMRTAEVNNLNMKGYGYPKLWNAIPNLKILDLSYTMWKRDLDKSDKIVLINEMLCTKDESGNPKPPTDEMKKIFVQVGSNARLPEEKALWQEYNPTVRIAEVTQSLDLALSLLSMSYGFGTKRYSFEQGRILTATEYAGERQDSMQEINKQRSESKDYITGIIDAIRWLYNALYDTPFQSQEVLINFDDSYIEDKKTTADTMRNDALSFGIDELTVWYLMKQYNISEDKALKLLGQQETDESEKEDTVPMDGNINSDEIEELTKA